MFKQFLRDENGQTTVEYLLIIAVLVVAITLFGRTLQQRLPQTVETLFDGINKKINGLMTAAGGP